MHNPDDMTIINDYLPPKPVIKNILMIFKVGKSGSDWPGLSFPTPFYYTVKRNPLSQPSSSGI